MPDLPRIYFDTNDQADDGAFLLSVFGAREDLRRMEDSLHRGMRVLLYMTGELEVEAELDYDDAWKCWVGRADMSTLRYLQ